MIKSYKIKLKPTKQQEEILWKHIHGARFIWNWALSYQKELYSNGKKYMSAYSLNKVMTQLRKQPEYLWLNDVSHATLGNTIIDLDKAYKTAFKKKKGFPKFKSRRIAKNSFSTACNRIYFKDDYVQIQSLGKTKYKTNLEFSKGKDVKILNPRISYTNKGKWILSFGIECENQTRELNNFSMGIDAGIKELAIVSYSNKHKVYKNINKTKRIRQLERKLKHIQRNTARKYEYNNKNKLYERKYHKSNNILKSEKQAKKLYEKLTNIRQDYIHKMTFELVEILPERIVIEDLNIVGMMKNRHLSKAISQCKWGEIFRQLEYKCSERGIEIIKVDRFYPSSKLCSKCGNIKTDLKLSDRVYKCECGFEIDRDINASVNLMNYSC